MALVIISEDAIGSPPSPKIHYFRDFTPGRSTTKLTTTIFNISTIEIECLKPDGIEIEGERFELAYLLKMSK